MVFKFLNKYPVVIRRRVRGDILFVYMPQINFYTYLSQSTWLILFFFTFYYCMKQYLLPTIVENLKLKKSLARRVSEIHSKTTLDNNFFPYNNL